MTLGPGKIIGSFFAVAAFLVALTSMERFQVATRMRQVTGVLADEPNGGKAVSYTIGRLGASKANTNNVTVGYYYTVNGKGYEGRILSINGNSYGSEERVKKIIADLQRSSDIPVWYDPKNPGFSVIIEPRIREEWVWLLSLSLLALLSFKYLDSLILTLQKKSK